MSVLAPKPIQRAYANPSFEQLLDSEEAASLLRIHPKTLEKMTRSGEIAGVPLCNERHYSIGEISKLWALSEKTLRRIFQNEPGVIQWGTEEKLHKRGYRTFRIPESVLVRVHHKLRKAS